jgi:sterol desaturase/sphingolipid hydroxylase (fatty acid hydroxylase superfamily)
MASGRSGMSAFDKWLERIVFGSFVATMVGEWWILRRRPKREFGDLDAATREELSDTSLPADELVAVGYERRDTTASLVMLAGSLVMGEVVWGPFNRRLDRLAYKHRRADVGSLGRGVGGFLAALVFWDFLYYWEHRWMHRVRVLWAHHVTHHSSERYNLSTALRQPWSTILTHWIFVPMPLAGFTPAMTRRAGEINLLYQYWIHTEVVDRLPARYEQWLNTASHHRVHHGANPQYIDRNYGGILIVWDKLFGTFEPEVRRVKYGLTKNIKTFNPMVIGYHEFVAIARDVKNAESTGARVGYVLRAPGWQPAKAA